MTAQRQAVQVPLRAATLDRQEVERVQIQRQAVAEQLSALLQVQGAPVQREVHPVSTKPQTASDWVTVMRHQAEQVEGKALDSRQYAQFTALQRQVAQTLAQGFRSDRGPVQARYDTYGEHLATLQRHEISAPVSRVVLGMVPAGERLALQRAVDAAVQRYESEAQQAATWAQRQSLQRQLAELDAEATQPVLQRIQERRGAGNPLPEAIQRHLEQGLNHDLSKVRVHDDAEADQLAKGVNAIAFTTGTDIFFQSGRFNPNSQSGLELLAHEVTHTVQQAQGRVGPGVDPDAGLEAEARTMGTKLAQVMPSAKGLLPPNPHAPGVYSKAAALQRVQDGAVQQVALKPLYDLYPQTVQRLGNPFSWAADQVKAGAQALADQGKAMIAGALTALPGYRELCLAFGKDLVTGKTMAGNPSAILDALAGWVPGPLKDILKAVKETNAIPKAWAWFSAELRKLDLGGALGEIGQAIGKADLGAAKNAVTRRISGLKNLIVGSARKIADIGLTALAAGLGPVGQQVVAKLRGSGDVIIQVLKNPGKFAQNLVQAVKGGFKTFSANAPRHLQNGLGQWLTGSTGIAFPVKFDLQGVFLTALSVMGLTYQAMRGRLVKALGPGGQEKVTKAEATVQVLQTMKGGLHKAEEVNAQKGDVGQEITSGIKGEVTKSLVLAGVQKLVTMLIPGGGFINAIIGAFQTVQTVVQQAAQIGAVITNALGSISAIAAGNISGAVGFIDRALGGAIPVALAWLSKVVGLGNFGGKVRAVINKTRAKLDQVLDKL
ncbi:eCIS core domain-containing protein, partial [Deinococcus multiflagellatus]